MDWNRVATSTFTGLIGLILVVAACIESIQKGEIDPALLSLTTAVVITFFGGNAIKQVNGNKVDALTASVMALHSRLDGLGVAAAKDGTQ